VIGAERSQAALKDAGLSREEHKGRKVEMGLARYALRAWRLRR
jgi:hypothetical protein